MNKQANKIISDAKSYGVTITLTNNVLTFAGQYKGSESVEKSLTRKINNYNLKVQGKEVA